MSPITSDVINSLAEEYSKLSKSLADVTGSLPSYDQRQSELQMKEFESALEELRYLLPKTRFAFKRNAKPLKSSQAPAPSHDAAPPTLPSIPIAPDSSNLSLSSRSNCYITLESLPISHSSDLTISDLDRCIVNLLPSSLSHRLGETGTIPASSQLQFSAIHVRNLSNTVLLLPMIGGSIMLHDLSRCVIVVGCHQFRMHESNAVDVYLATQSNPVIENSHRIRFTTYPDSLMLEGAPTDSVLASISNPSVQDFSHIRATPSPNWSILPPSSQIKEWPQHEVPSTEFDLILGNLLPAQATS